MSGDFCCFPVEEQVMAREGIPGNITQNVESTEAGKQRKRAARKAEEKARLARQEQSQRDSDRAFLTLASQASPSRMYIISGIVGKRVVLDLSHVSGEKTISGKIVVEVVQVPFGPHELGRLIPAIKVIGSNYSLVPADPDLWLHAHLLMKSDFQTRLEGRRAEQQRKMWEVLRTACAKEIEEKNLTRKVRQEEPQGQTTPAGQVSIEVTPPAVHVPVRPAFDTSGAVTLTVSHIAQKAGQWNGEVLKVCAERGCAYFVRELVAGSRKLVLVYADDDHELAPILDAHASVQLDFAEFLRAEPQPARDLHDIREARKEVARYVYHELRRLGLKPRVVQQETTSAPALRVKDFKALSHVK